MVAVVAGNGLGLFNSSLNVLGTSGMLGRPTLGRNGGAAYVNAATGNLVLQFSDDDLSGRGADLSLLRTYNSLGRMLGEPDPTGDGWQWDQERTVVFTPGAHNEGRNAGGTVTRTTGDGHVTVYTWNSATQTYVSHDGDGANDFFTFVPATAGQAAEWIWTDGSTQQRDLYSDSSASSPGQLLSQTDVSGNTIKFGYDGALLTDITDLGSGQKIKLVYSAGQLQEVDTFELLTDPTTGQVTDPPTIGSSPIKQVRYTYDNGRLGSVKTLLNPDAADSPVFVTTYTYVDDRSHLIKSISQNDGTATGTSYRVNFTYTTDGTNRVATVTDASGTQTFIYKANSTDITLSDAGGGPQTWTYIYDPVTGQLGQIDAPAPAPGAERLSTQFQYDAAGNLTEVIDARGNAIIYQYDANGNQILERDSLG
ncbi:MAG TPA: RHS repeat domain-containing protein, partial [Steroidobacteraceae bacterium]